MKASMFVAALALWSNDLLAQTFPYNAVTDFSTTVNSESSTWSYRSKVGEGIDAIGGKANANFSLLTSYGPANGNWTVNPNAWSNGSASRPYVGLNKTGQTVSNSTASDNFSLANGTFFLRPAAGSPAVLCWAYPFSFPSNIQVVSTWADIDNHGGDGVTRYIEYRSAGGTLTGYSFGGGGHDGDTGGTGTHSGPALPGDRVYFIITASNQGVGTNDAFDAAMLTVNIVPEPSTFALLAIGGIFIVGLNPSRLSRSRLKPAIL